MGVQNVIVAHACEARQGLTEVIGDVGHPFLGKRARRTRHELVQGDSRQQLALEGFAGGARHEVHLDIADREFGGHGEDGDVEPARVGGGGLRGGRGVHRDHRDALDGYRHAATVLCGVWVWFVGCGARAGCVR